MGIDMSDAPDQRLLEALLDSWDRNNTILLNLLRALPEGGLEARAMEGSPSVAELFTHIHYVRLVFISEDAPAFARHLPDEEWADERDPSRLAPMLNAHRRKSQNGPWSASNPVVYCRPASGLSAISGLCCSCRIRMIWPAFGACNNVHGRCSSVMRPRLPI